jgi:hypothetical protein
MKYLLTTIPLSLIAITGCNQTSHKSIPIKQINTPLNHNISSNIATLDYKSFFHDFKIHGIEIPKYNKYEQYYLLSKSTQNYFSLFIILHKDESCCKSIYYATKDSHNTPVDFEKVAISGSDGDWSETDTLQSTFPKSTIVKKIIKQQIFNNSTNDYSHELIDNLTYKILINQSGRISKSTIDSTRTFNNL